jgi:predicted AAA+ superfamily ATPase
MEKLQRSVFNELLSHHPKDKMLFLAGPRQVGKTFLAKQALLLNENKGRYFNWDIASDRKAILAHGKK